MKVPGMGCRDHKKDVNFSRSSLFTLVFPSFFISSNLSEEALRRSSALVGGGFSTSKNRFPEQDENRSQRTLPNVGLVACWLVARVGQRNHEILSLPVGHQFSDKTAALFGSFCFFWPGVFKVILGLAGEFCGFCSLSMLFWLLWLVWLSALVILVSVLACDDHHSDRECDHGTESSCSSCSCSGFGGCGFLNQRNR